MKLDLTGVRRHFGAYEQKYQQDSGKTIEDDVQEFIDYAVMMMTLENNYAIREINERLSKLTRLYNDLLKKVNDSSGNNNLLKG